MNKRNNSTGAGLGRRASLRRLAAGGMALALRGAGATVPGLEPGAGLNGLLDGSLFVRGEPGYEVQRQSLVWHLRKPGRQPGLIVNAASVEDVQTCLRYARGNGLQVAVRGGGHHSACAALREGGLALNLGALADILVDLDTGHAEIGPAVRAGTLIRMLAPAGLAFPVAHHASVGMSGFLLGGGLGWNPNGWGVACNAVEAADIVLADGTLVRASVLENPDLLWAVRGAGPGFFGAVTRLRIRLFPMPRAIMACSVVHPLASTGQVIGTLTEISAAAAPEVETTALITQPPAGGRRARPVLMINTIAWSDSEAAAREALAPFSSGPLVAGASAIVPPAATGFDEFFAPAATASQFGRYATDNCWTDDPAAAMQALAALARPLPSPRSQVLMTLKRDTLLRTDTAFSSVGRAYLGRYALWDDPAADQRHRQWLRETAAVLEPHAVGHYVNEVDATGDPDSVRRSFSPEAWRRLRALRTEYDPDAVFFDFPATAA